MDDGEERREGIGWMIEGGLWRGWRVGRMKREDEKDGKRGNGRPFICED